jgi:hypothetical protein
MKVIQKFVGSLDREIQSVEQYLAEQEKGR